MKFDHDLLKRMREAKGMSQAQLAKKVERTRQTVANWESGSCEPGYEELGKIGDAFGVNATLFLKNTPAKEGV